MHYVSPYIVVHSFVELVKYIFTIPGVSVFLSNRLCQDPLENFFGIERQRGRVNENPTAKEFLQNTQALKVIQNTCRNIRGNCQRSEIAYDNSPLPKRSRKTAKTLKL